MKRNGIITGTGMHVPERVVPNSYFNDVLGEDVDTWLQQNLGIRERRWCGPDDSASTLAIAAVNAALQDAGTTPESVDLLIVATDTPDYISPSTASVVQYATGMRRAGTFDINTACAGFVTALETGIKFIQADERYNTVVITGTYAMSKYIDVHDKKTANLFADGAGAVVLRSTTEQRGHLAGELFTAGEYHDWMGIYYGGTRHPVTPEALAEKEHLLKFVKKFPKEINPRQWSAMIRNVTERAGVQVSDIQRYFFTQINRNGIWETLDLLGEPREKAPLIMEKYAYTGSACIPMALAEAERLQQLHTGDLAVFMGSGGGLSFACSLFRW